MSTEKKINDPNDIDFGPKCSSFDLAFRYEKSLGQSIRLGSYRSGDAATVSWLITPEIDVGSLNQPHLAFRTSTSFADNSVLEVFYSTDL